MLESWLSGEIPQYADDTTHGRKQRNTKSLLRKVKEDSEKISLKLNIQKTKIMASGPIISWEIDEETVKTVRDFIFLGSKITADGDCSHEIKWHLVLGRKVMTNLDCILKRRDITLPTKVHLVKAMVFPAVKYGCESWTVKKSECWRIDAFELWCWRRCLRVPWTARRSNQSILKEISPGCSLEGLMLKLKYFGHLMQRTDLLEKTLMLGKTEGRRRRGNRGWEGWMASPTQWTWIWANSGRQWRTRKPGVLLSMGSQRAGHDWATEQQIIRKGCGRTTHIVWGWARSTLRSDRQRLPGPMWSPQDAGFWLQPCYAVLGSQTPEGKPHLLALGPSAAP